ncbi:hypothetical protein KIH74_29640 [Kineosporia sp. J2-2]|uniref:Uncharacterized protein n=1 Tax=Kineosporia corallincola TaxID=2835133 RepID=A0ABS5TQX7_9ACTN|nr:hypothetical protein [Kineosporia corallincola]MBT0773144.1 hypothetical protein [Kineosporia corallincola]
MKKVTAVGAAALVVGGVLAGGVTLLAPAAQAAQASPAGQAVRAGRATPVRPAAAATLPQAGHQTAYVQRADTVTVYRDGTMQAQVTAESAAHPRGKGKLVLTVAAKKDFSFRAGQWLWEDPDGGDHEAVNTRRKISVPAGTTQTVSINYSGVGNGDVIWTPDASSVAGAWYVKGAAVQGASKFLPTSYVQQGGTVSVYRAGKVVARVTPRSAEHADGKGTLKLDVEAVKKFSVVPASFLWEDADGGDHEAIGDKKAVTVKAKTSKTVTVKYADVAEGTIVWSPRDDSVAGAWTVD